MIEEYTEKAMITSENDLDLGFEFRLFRSDFGG